MIHEFGWKQTDYDLLAAGTIITTVTDPTHIILSANATIANGVTVTFGSTSNTNSLVVVNPAGITVGQLVSGGTNVPAGAVVTNISGNTVTLSGNIGTAIAPATAITFGAITNFTGGVTVTGGTFQVRPTATSGNGSAPLTASNPLTFNADTANFGNQWAGGTFEYANNAPGSVGVALSVCALSPTAGAGLVQIDAPLVSGTNAVTFASLGTVANGTALSFLSPAGTSVTVTGAVNVNGIINAHIYYGTTGTGGADFALSTAGVIGPALYTAFAGGAIEDQRECRVVAHAEDDEGGEALGVGDDAARVDALARELFEDEAAHLLVANPRDDGRPQAEPCRADGDVGGAAADGLDERAHVLEPPADLLAVKVDRRAANGNDIECGGGR